MNTLNEKIKVFGRINSRQLYCHYKYDQVFMVIGKNILLFNSTIDGWSLSIKGKFTVYSNGKVIIYDYPNSWSFFSEHSDKLINRKLVKSMRRCAEHQPFLGSSFKGFE